MSLEHTNGTKKISSTGFGDPAAGPDYRTGYLGRGLGPACKPNLL